MADKRLGFLSAITRFKTTRAGLTRIGAGFKFTRKGPEHG